MSEPQHENRRMTDTCPPWLQHKLQVLEEVNTNLKVLEQRLETLLTQVDKHDTVAETTITNKFAIKLMGMGLVLLTPFAIAWNVYITSEIQDLRKQVTILESRPKP